MRKKQLFAAAALLLLSAVVMSGCGGIYIGDDGIYIGDNNVNMDDLVNIGDNSAVPAYEDKGSKAMDIADGTVTVDADDIRLNIVGSDVSQVQVDYAKQVFNKTITQEQAQEIMDKMSVTFAQNGSEARIKSRTNNQRNALIKMDIKMPAGMRLTIKSGDGAINVKNIAGDINLESGDGLIDVTDAGGNVKIDKGDGTVKLSSGSIGDMSINSSDGKVSVSLDKLTGDEYTISSGDGIVNMSLPGDVAADFKITAGDGIVKCGFPLSKWGKTYTGSVNGGGKSIKINSGDGTVNVEKK